jgi:hypothetical protein
LGKRRVGLRHNTLLSRGRIFAGMEAGSKEGQSATAALISGRGAN